MPGYVEPVWTCSGCGDEMPNSKAPANSGIAHSCSKSKLGGDLIADTLRRAGYHIEKVPE
jgi:hypothetical protein